MNCIARSALVSAFLLPAGCSLLELPEHSTATQSHVCPTVEEVACPPPRTRVVEKVIVREVPAPPPPAATTAGPLHLPIVGAVELARVEPPGLVMEARVDTGAETTSIHAEDIRLLERDGKAYVSFLVIDDASGEQHRLERRLQRRVLIKRHDAEPEQRLVVNLWITLGNSSGLVEVTLSDREIFEYSLLVGRNFLTDMVIVDVARHHTQGPPMDARSVSLQEPAGADAPAPAAPARP